MIGYVFQGTANGKPNLTVACRSINTSIGEGYYSVNLDVVDMESAFLTEMETVLAEQEISNCISDIVILHEDADGVRTPVATMADLCVTNVNKSFFSPENQNCNVSLNLCAKAPVVAEENAIEE